MENGFKEVSNNSYLQNQSNKNQNKSIKHKKKLKTIVIILLIPTIMMYGFLLFVGAIPIPRLHIIANFYLNKNHFERLVDSDIKHCSNFSGEIDSYISNIDDEELQKSMKVLFKGIWGGMTKNNSQHIYFFKTYNYTYAKARGILYYEGERDNIKYCFGDYDYVYRCEPLEDGWYYYEADHRNTE